MRIVGRTVEVVRKMNCGCCSVVMRTLAWHPNQMPISTGIRPVVMSFAALNSFLVRILEGTRFANGLTIPDG